jgi:hypothetical protein
MILGWKMKRSHQEVTLVEKLVEKVEGGLLKLDT